MIEPWPVTSILSFHSIKKGIFHWRLLIPDAYIHHPTLIPFLYLLSQKHPTSAAFDTWPLLGVKGAPSDRSQSRDASQTYIISCRGCELGQWPRQALCLSWMKWRRARVTAGCVYVLWWKSLWLWIEKRHWGERAVISFCCLMSFSVWSNSGLGFKVTDEVLEDTSVNNSVKMTWKQHVANRLLWLKKMKKLKQSDHQNSFECLKWDFKRITKWKYFWCLQIGSCLRCSQDKNHINVPL